MAVLMMMDLPGVTIEQYEQMNDRLGIHSADDLPEGCLAHAAGASGDGIEIIDVWESAEAFEEFVEHRLVPASEGLDLPQPEPSVHPVHNRIPAGRGETAGVLMIMDMPDVSPDDYDQMTSQLDAHAGDGSDHPSVSHTVATPATGGILVVDVWESPDAFGRFADEQLAPLFPEGAAPVEPRVVAVHNHLSTQSQAAAQGRS
jgi:hypothetical protein